MTSGGASTFGPFRLDPTTESVWRGVEELRLRPKTFAVLRYLAERPGRLVVKEEHYHRGDLADTLECARDVVALGTTHGFSGWIDDGAVVLAATGPRDDHGHDVVGDLYQRIRSGSPGRAVWRNVLCLCVLARAAADRDDVKTAFEILDAIPEEQRGALFASEIQRVRGELLMRCGQGDEAERCFRRALGIAHDRGERSLELRAATSLAKLLARTDQGDEARRTLAGIYGWFTEGFDTADLREARSLLAELEGGAASKQRS